jgi:hypothetical protein
VPAGTGAVEKSPAVRERIARDAESMYADLAAFFKNALEADRKVWGYLLSLRQAHRGRDSGLDRPGEGGRDDAQPRLRPTPQR